MRCSFFFFSFSFAENGSCLKRALVGFVTNLLEEGSHFESCKMADWARYRHVSVSPPNHIIQKALSASVCLIFAQIALLALLLLSLNTSVYRPDSAVSHTSL